MASNLIAMASKLEWFQSQSGLAEWSEARQKAVGHLAARGWDLPTNPAASFTQYW